MNVILGKSDTYDPELLKKLSKTDLALIYLKHGGERSKIINYRGSESWVEKAMSCMDVYSPKIYQGNDFKSWTRPQIVKWILELI